ncbi:NAD(P)-binding protein [Thozetella sp. PMI_491]|nr:NAD(P)-binding protein [Thozetella sp. PMI_491]
MSTTIKKVAIAGAAGDLGKVVFARLVSSGLFELRVLRRIGSKSTYPEGTDVVDVDFDSVDSLKAALVGQDAVISTVGYTGHHTQVALIEAAAAAGVGRIIPSEFGANQDMPATRQLPVFMEKTKVHEQLIKTAETTGLTYTLMYNNSFLDWGLERDFILPVVDGKRVIIDGGDLPFSATTLSSVADAVVGVLTHPEETKNRSVRYHDLITTQNQILAILKKVAPTRSWEVMHAKLDDLTAAADARLAKGLYDVETFAPYLARATFDPACGGKFDTNDNELLGVKGLSEEDVTQIAAKIFN